VSQGFFSKKSNNENIAVAVDRAFVLGLNSPANYFASRYLALSMELIEFGEEGTYKHNNIHKRFKK
jgi:5-carboxymethyl-2-hydroxymuconate isomerase